MLSVVLVPIYWLTAQFVTPGSVIANRIVNSQPESRGLEDLSERLNIVLVVDFAVWFAALWAGLNLWTEFNRELQEQGATRHWTNPLHMRSIVDATLCALPLTSYLVIGVAKILNRKNLLESMLWFLSTVSLSLFVHRGNLRVVCYCGEILAQVKVRKQKHPGDCRKHRPRSPEHSSTDGFILLGLCEDSYFKLYSCPPLFSHFSSPPRMLKRFSS